MKIEELKEHCVRQITKFERFKDIILVTPNDYKHYEEHKMVLSLIEAWEKVKVEMHEQYRIFANIPSIGDVWADAIEIVDKHLSEVSE